MVRDKEVNILIDRKALENRIKELASIIEKDFNSDIYAICVLKGGFMFFSELLKGISKDVYIDFIQVSSYMESTKSSGKIIFLKDISFDISNKEVLLVDDIFDTGLTLKALKDYILSKNPRSLKIAVLLDKKVEKKVDIKPDYVGFYVDNKFIVGYGLDWAELGRNFPFIGYIDE